MTSSGDDAPDLIDRLVRHGLGQGEARCYVAMLAPRAFRVSEIALGAGLPRSRTYELIRSLVRAGLCTEVASGAVARFRAVPPNEAIGRLETFLSEQTRRRRLALVGVYQGLQGLDGGQALARSGGEPIEALRRRDQLVEAYGRALAGATDEVVRQARTPWDVAESSGLLDSLGRGVTHRTVHERSLCASNHGRALAAFYAQYGEQVRVVERLDVAFTLFDRATIILTLPAGGTQGPGAQLESLLIRHAGLGQTLYEAFERQWAAGVPLDRALAETDGRQGRLEGGGTASAPPGSTPASNP